MKRAPSARLPSLASAYPTYPSVEVSEAFRNNAVARTRRASIRWTSRAPAPHAHSYPAAGVINGKRNVAGGYSATGAVAVMVEYL
jgi:hypothetical protein